jgi:hypothetical protein
MMRHSKISLAGLSFVMLFAIGCEDNLTRKRFDTIREGFSSQLDVSETLGDPDVKQNNVWHYMRHDKHLFVDVEFNDEGKVTGKQWKDGKSGEWDDSGSMKGPSDGGGAAKRSSDGRSTVN